MTNLKQLLNKPVSQLPDGATGYRRMTEEQFLNDLADDTDIQIIEADDFLDRLVLNGFTLPETLNTIDWWKVFNQGPIGSCLGCSDAQTGTGVHWLESGERVEFSKFGHYITIQLVGGMFGRDVGSVPTDALKVAAKIGYCPEVWTEHLERVYQNHYNEPSEIPAGTRIAPAYPRDYRSGIQSTAWRKYLAEVKNPDSKRRKIMALFRMDKYVRISKVSQIQKAKRAGMGFIQQSSLWTEAYDAHPKRIDRIYGRGGGGHAYQIIDITPDGEPILGNTWDARWGDDGAKVISVNAEQEVLDQKYTLAYLKTDMPFDASKPLGPRKIKIIGSNF